MLRRTEALSLFQTMSSLYQQEMAERPIDYLAFHGQPGAIAHQINVFGWYAEHLPATGTVLDWGCAHGPDLCMLRGAFGDRFELHGCDFSAADAYPVFRSHARAEYRQIEDPLHLPYPANQFDAVIASGVLEHTAMEYESLKELYRVLKPGGLVAISYLPSRWSIGEWRLRRRKAPCHRKLYNHGDLRRLLMRTGFWHEEVRFQSYLPDRFEKENENKRRSPIASMWRMVMNLRRTLTLPISHDVLCGLARKQIVF